MNGRSTKEAISHNESLSKKRTDFPDKPNGTKLGIDSKEPSMA
jgi:hypothetical protein